MWIFISFFSINLITAQSVSVWDGTSEIWTQGSGTEANPYLIQNAQQLAYIAEMVNGGVTHYENTYFKLTTNIQIDSTTSWNPIGLNNTYYFSGHFDGDNHLVTLHLHTSTLQYVGLFGYVQNSSIRNLELDGAIERLSNSTGSFAGSVVAYAQGTTISNCNNTANISSTSSLIYSYAGGIVGHAFVGTSIKNCHNSGRVSCFFSGSSSSTPLNSSFSYAGGITGFFRSGTTITNCYNTGNIMSSTYSGGIAGYCMAITNINSNISNCYNSGNVNATGAFFTLCSGGITGWGCIISNCYNTGEVFASNTASGDVYVYSGGITGSGEDISDCYNLGSVASYSASGHQISSGGIKGYGNGRITNCYNMGNISSLLSSGPSGNTYSGGIVGTGYSIMTVNCYNKGSVVANHRGGIRGINTGTVINCYYLDSCGGMVVGGIEKTHSQMISSSFPALLNADSMVYVQDLTPNINQGYPIFGKVYTLDADNIGNTSIMLHGKFQMQFEVDTCGFEYKKSSASSYTTIFSSGNSLVSELLAGLQSGTQYTFRFFVKKNNTYYRGADKTFSTLQCSLTAHIASSSNVLCEGDTLFYSVYPSSLDASSFQYIWNTGDTTSIIQITNANTYSVTVTDNNGCTTTDSQTVIMSPSSTHINGNPYLCDNQSTILYVSESGTYLWNTGENTSSIIASQTGFYTVTITLNNGCTSYASTTVLSAMLPTPTISGNTTLCQGQTTTLTANGGNSYTWSNGSTNNNINISQSGVYTVTATNVEGCSATAQVSVNINPLPTVTIAGNTTICAGNSTTLTASGADTYSWSTGDNTATVNINAFGVYTVTGTSSAGCSSTANVTVLVSQAPQITITGETDICAGESTTLTATGGTSYLWSNGTTDATLTTSQAGTYQVIGYNEAGCNTMASVTVNLWQPATSEFSISCPDSCYTWNGESYCQSGDYTQTLQTIHGCDSVVTLHLTITVGIDNHDLTASMTVYPNPTNGVVNVQFTMNNVQAKTTEIQLYDAYGKLLQVRDGNASQIDLSPFAPGVYFVKAVTNGNMMGVRKVVKQ